MQKSPGTCLILPLQLINDREKNRTDPMEKKIRKIGNLPGGKNCREK